MRLRTDVIGALNPSGADARLLDSDEARVGRALTDVATIGLLDERGIHRGEVLTEQLQVALQQPGGHRVGWFGSTPAAPRRAPPGEIRGRPWSRTVREAVDALRPARGD